MKKQQTLSSHALVANLAKNIQNIVHKNVGAYFGAPSVYFHLEAIRLCRSNQFLSDEHIKMIYAGLCAWGMHRMGPTGAKLAEFDTFKNSILARKQQFMKFRNVRIDNLTKAEYDAIIDELTDLVFSIVASISSVNLVANTKTVAHILPDLVPFVDRRYTLHFLTGKGLDDGINVSPKNEQNWFKAAMNVLFVFSHDATIKPFLIINPKTLDTSIPKIFDNWIISYLI